jgi:hypothetical protein
MTIPRHARAVAAALALALAAAGPGPARAQEALSQEDALRAVEEAELRERIVTALAIAESVRLRGRTILVAMSEIGRVRRRVERLDPTSERRAEFEERLARLEERRAEMDAELDDEFLVYLEIVSELAGGAWSRIDRVGGQVLESLEERRIERLQQLYPIVRGHIEEFHRAGAVTRAVTGRWRREIDDTYDLRRERLRAAPPPEPSLAEPEESEEDI